MIFTCIGGDRRQLEVANYLMSQNHKVSVIGLPDYNNNIHFSNVSEAILLSDAVILPLPVTFDSETVNVKLTDKIIYLKDIIQYKPKCLFGGIISNQLKNELIYNGIKHYDYYKSEPLTVKNAVLTAESAVAIAINCTDISIFNSKSLVIGYGRIGKIVAKYLKTLGSEVTATSRNEGVLAHIEADLLTAVNTNNIADCAGDFDFIFNTAPFPVMNRNFFKNCKKTVFVEDLATDSGTDFSSAAYYGINAAIYSGLPGKYSPKTAGHYIGEEILSKMIGGSNEK